MDPRQAARERYRRDRESHWGGWTRVGAVFAPAVPLYPLWPAIANSGWIGTAAGAIVVVQLLLIVGPAEALSAWLVRRDMARAERQGRFD